MKKIYGDDARQFLREQLEDAKNKMAAELAPFEPNGAFNAYFNTYRAIEEFINLPNLDIEDASLELELFHYRLDRLDPVQLASVRSQLLPHADNGVVNRLMALIVQSAAMYSAFMQHGVYEAAAGLQSVAHAMGYFQSRRRHLLALLHCVPSACTGTEKFEAIESLPIFLPRAEEEGIPIAAISNMLMLSQLYADFHVLTTSHGYGSSHTYEMLDSSFLEPERAGLDEVALDVEGKAFTDGLEDVPNGKIFSPAELRNDIHIISTAYSEFHLAENVSYAPMADFVIACSKLSEDDYYIRLSAKEFHDLTLLHALSPSMTKALVQSGGDYVANLESYAPFIANNSGYVTSVTLLSRFMHQWKIRILNRLKRFQIRSGFIFEDSVKKALATQGFNVTGIKRIDGSEFDVVATSRDVIYNVQCKNNLVDYSRIESNPRLFVRYNRQLDRYYAQALLKEKAREELLKKELSLPKIIHLVVTRFPISTTNPKVIAFKEIDRFADLTSKLL